jgi:hypothetical protein
MGTDYRSSEAGSYKYDEEEHEEQHLCVHNCRHPEDWVPPHTSSKSRQGAERASTRCHASCSFGPHLPTEVGSGAAMCHMVPILTSWLR